MKRQKDETKAESLMEANAARKRARQIERSRDKLLEISEAAADKGSYAPAVQAMSRAAGLDAEIRRCETAAEVAETLDPLRRVELMMVQALVDGSMAAAATLTDQLRTMKAEEDARRLAAEEAARQAADPEAQFNALVEALRGMPPDQSTRLRDELGWHR